MKFTKPPLTTVLLHVLCWSAFLFLPYLFFLPSHRAPYMPHPSFDHAWNSISRDMVADALLIVFFYANIYILIPRYYINRKYVWFIALVFLCYIPVALAPVFLFPVGPTGLWYENRNGFEIIRDLSHHLLRFIALFFVSLVLTISDRWKQSQKEKTNAELLYLKSQINPHFLFNTLNSIYALAVTKSDRTGDALVKLSGMMRYITSDVHADAVPLDKEINYVISYVELQKLRWGNTVKVLFNNDGDLKGKYIAPLILIPFIENAFKHGVNPEVPDAFVQINLHVDNNALTLKVTNLKVRQNHDVEEHSGIGVENTSQRLKLVYPGKHKLEIKEDERIFSVILSLELT